MIEILLSGTVPFGLTHADFDDAAAETFRVARKATKGSIGVSFVTDAKMRSLNKKYRKKDKTTDVLSFGEPEIPQLRGVPRHWGDIFISSAYVKGEAKRRGIDPKEEVVRVFVHGILHLFGYDHATEAEELEMFTLQERAVASTDV